MSWMTKGSLELVDELIIGEGILKFPRLPKESGARMCNQADGRVSQERGRKLRAVIDDLDHSQLDPLCNFLFFLNV